MPVKSHPVKLNNFVVPVFNFLKKLPKGRVTTYGALAKRFHVPAPRNIGWILKQNAEPDRIPCYKVIRADGRLAGGYKFGGLKEQRRRLLADGVKFKNNRVVF